MKGRGDKQLEKAKDKLDDIKEEANTTRQRALTLINVITNDIGNNNNIINQTISSINSVINNYNRYLNDNRLNVFIDRLKILITELQNRYTIIQNHNIDQQNINKLYSQAENGPHSNLSQTPQKRKKDCNGRSCQLQNVQKKLTPEQTKRAAREARILKQSRKKVFPQKKLQRERIPPGPLRNHPSPEPEQFVKNLTKDEEVNSFNKLTSGYDNLRSDLYTRDIQLNTTEQRDVITEVNKNLTSFVNHKVTPVINGERRTLALFLSGPNFK